MTNVNADLFEAFHQDHALLGKGLHAIRTKLSGGDIKAAQAAARRLHADAGAHIAFEEADFYPALAPFLSAEEITAMYEHHDEGLALVKGMISLTETDLSSTDTDSLLKRIDVFEAHISECGELFGAMGGLSKEQQALLLEKLEAWRKKAPSWTEATALARTARS